MRGRAFVIGFLLALPLLSVASPADAALPNCTRTATSTNGTSTVTVPASSVGYAECVMAQGNQSSGVTAMQRALKTCHGKSIATDGIFGPATRTALIQVQRALGVNDDGVYGPKTGSKMSWPGYDSGTFVGCRRTTVIQP